MVRDLIFLCLSFTFVLCVYNIIFIVLDIFCLVLGAALSSHNVSLINEIVYRPRFILFSVAECLTFSLIFGFKYL